MLFRSTYQGAALGAFLASIPLTVNSAFGIWGFVEALPLFSYGFAWLPFAVVGGLLGALLGRRMQAHRPHHPRESA